MARTSGWRWRRSAGECGALQVARSLEEVDGVLERLRLVLLLVALGGIALAAVLGRLVAGRAVEPLGRLTRTAD